MSARCLRTSNKATFQLCRPESPDACAISPDVRCFARPFANRKCLTESVRTSKRCFTQRAARRQMRILEALLVLLFIFVRRSSTPAAATSFIRVSSQKVNYLRSPLLSQQNVQFSSCRSFLLVGRSVGGLGRSVGLSVDGSVGRSVGGWVGRSMVESARRSVGQSVCRSVSRSAATFGRLVRRSVG